MVMLNLRAALASPRLVFIKTFIFEALESVAWVLFMISLKRWQDRISVAINLLSSPS